MAQTTSTPLFQQYQNMKSKHADAIVLFRVGDFYETFCDDAIAVSEICGLTLIRRTNGSEITELAGFPHHALDSYLPKLVRAGRRVAICEEPKDPSDANNVVEVVEPSTEPTTDPAPTEATPEPAPEPKPIDRGKEFNCVMTPEQFRELGEPIAFFQVDFPKWAKELATAIDKNTPRPAIDKVCIEPETGKAIATDTKILHIADIECSGIWPGHDEGKQPWRCYIEPRAVAALAGKRADIAVWETEKGENIVTAVEAVGVEAQLLGKVGVYPDWQRVNQKSTIASIRFTEEGAKLVNKTAKANMGKKKSERENGVLVIYVDRYARTANVKFYGAYDYGTHPLLAELKEVPLAEQSEREIQQTYNIEKFYHATAADFTGEMLFSCDSYGVTKFMGVGRETLLMNCICNEHQIYVK